MTDRAPRLRFLSAILLTVFSLGFIIVLAELTLRAIPRLTPKGVYGSGVFDPEIGLRVHGSPVIYNKVRFVRHVPNGSGFLDVEHKPAKPPNLAFLAATCNNEKTPTYETKP